MFDLKGLFFQVKHYNFFVLQKMFNACMYVCLSFNPASVIPCTVVVTSRSRA